MDLLAVPLEPDEEQRRVHDVVPAWHEPAGEHVHRRRQQAVLERDYPLLQGVFLIITFAVLTANLIADFAYVLLDPRTRQEA